MSKEYKILKHATLNGLENQINSYGDNGWNVSGGIMENDQAYRVIMEREKPEALNEVPNNGGKNLLHD